MSFVIFLILQEYNLRPRGVLLEDYKNARTTKHRIQTKLARRLLKMGLRFCQRPWRNDLRWQRRRRQNGWTGGLQKTDG